MQAQTMERAQKTMVEAQRTEEGHSDAAEQESKEEYMHLSVKDDEDGLVQMI